MEEINSYILNNDLEKVKEYLNLHNDISENKKQLLMINTVNHGHLDILKYMVDKFGINLGFKKNYLIGIAARNDRYEVVKYLMNHPDVNPADDNNYAIQVARMWDITDIVKLLLSDSRVIKNLTYDQMNQIGLLEYFKEMYNIDSDEDIKIILNIMM
jgi:hypothetical protein